MHNAMFFFGAATIRLAGSEAAGGKTFLRRSVSTTTAHAGDGLATG